MDATLIAAFCKHYGRQVGGGYEILIPNSVVGSIPRTGQVQQVPDPSGFKLVFYPNITIEGVFDAIPVTSPPTPEPTSPPVQHVDEWA